MREGTGGGGAWDSNVILQFVLLATAKHERFCDNSSKGICKPRVGPINGVLALALAMVLQRATGNKHI